MKETYKILIISEVQGYIIMSLKDKIKEAGYQVSVVEPDVAQISAERDTIGAYLIYGSDGDRRYAAGSDLSQRPVSRARHSHLYGGKQGRK